MWSKAHVYLSAVQGCPLNSMTRSAEAVLFKDTLLGSGLGSDAGVVLTVFL